MHAFLRDKLHRYFYFAVRIRAAGTSGQEENPRLTPRYKKREGGRDRERERVRRRVRCARTIAIMPGHARSSRASGGVHRALWTLSPQPVCARYTRDLLHRIFAKLRPVWPRHDRRTDRRGASSCAKARLVAGASAPRRAE